jgi:hypothetical protein
MLTFLEKFAQNVADPSAPASTAAALSVIRFTSFMDHIDAINDDARLLSDERLTPEHLAVTRLWPSVVGPPRVSAAWGDLRVELEGLGVPCWRIWYDDVLLGNEPYPGWEEAFTDVPGPLPWQSGATAVNAAIERRLKQIAPGTPHQGPSGQIVGVPIAAIEALPAPIEEVFSAVDFTATRGRPIRAKPAVEVQAVLKTPVDKRDHKPRLDLCRDSASRLLEMINQGRFNVRDGYRQALSDYVRHLPANTRILRDLFVADVDILSPEFAARLKAMLQAHQALRVFYPGLERFYDDVRFGRTSEPLPIDAAERIADIVEEAPHIFDSTVVQALSDAAPPLPAPTEPPAETGRTDLQPPPDPMGSLPTEKAQAYARAGIINRLWAVFEKGEAINKNAESWVRTGQTLAPHIIKVLDWLNRFWPGGGDGPPPMPPPIVT